MPTIHRSRILVVWSSAMLIDTVLDWRSIRDCLDHQQQFRGAILSVSSFKGAPRCSSKAGACAMAQWPVQVWHNLHGFKQKLTWRSGVDPSVFWVFEHPHNFGRWCSPVSEHPQIFPANMRFLPANGVHLQSIHLLTWRLKQCLLLFTV